MLPVELYYLKSFNLLPHSVNVTLSSIQRVLSATPCITYIMYFRMVCMSLVCSLHCTATNLESRHLWFVVYKAAVPPN